MTSAVPGLRLAAFLVDAWLVLASTTLVGALAQRAASLGTLSSSAGVTASVVWLALVAAAYPVLEWRWGGSPGKRLFALGISSSRGGRARLPAVALRFAVFAPLALAYPIAAVAEAHGFGFGAALTPELIGLVGWLALGATMGRREGGVGLHEWLSGTRLRARVEHEGPGVSRRRRVAALLCHVAIPFTLMSLAGLLLLAEPWPDPAGLRPFGFRVAEATGDGIRWLAVPLWGLSAVSAVAFRGGLALSLVGIRVESPGGGACRLALRALAAWTPLVAAALLRPSHPAIAGVLLLVGIAGLGVAIARPDRGLQDRLAGTRLVFAGAGGPAPRALRYRWLGAALLVALAVVATAVVPTWQLRLRSRVDVWLAPLVTPAVEVSEETTRLLEPLLSDGTPDYAAELNRLQAIPAEDNAAIPLTRLSPFPDYEPGLRARHGLGGEVLPAALDGSAPPYVLWELSWPWLPDDHPELADWLAEHGPQLDEIRASAAAAAERERFWQPEPEGRLYGTVRFPSLLPVRRAADGLCARALLRVHERRWTAASADLIATYRLAGVLLGGADYIHRLIGASLLMKAAEASFPAIPRLPAADAAALSAAVRDLSPPENPVSGLEAELRYADLANVLQIRRAGLREGPGRWRAFYGEDPPLNLLRVPASAVDWNEALRIVNRYHDRLWEEVAATDPERQGRFPGFAELGFEWAETAETPTRPWQRAAAASLDSPRFEALLARARHDPEARVEMTRAVLAAHWIPTGVRFWRRLANAARALHQLARLALVLRLRAEEAGSFPGSLEGLSASLPGSPWDPAAHHGYRFRYHSGPASGRSAEGPLGYALTAVPVVPEETGGRSFCVDDAGGYGGTFDGTEPTLRDGRCRGWYEGHEE